MNDTQVQIVSARIVSQEVLVCVSHLVSTLAKGMGNNFNRDMSELCSQAFDLTCPVEDLSECEAGTGEPYYWDVYEHWAITDWLADKLLAHGEKVDKDFAGLCVWARTTTGQAISMDAVVQKIASEIL